MKQEQSLAALLGALDGLLAPAAAASRNPPRRYRARATESATPDENETGPLDDAVGG